MALESEYFERRHLGASPDPGWQLAAIKPFNEKFYAEKDLEPRDFYVVPPVRWAFYGFIATIPFETINLGIPIEITMISLGILILSLVFQMPVVFRKPPAAFWLFLLYAVIFAIPILLMSAYYKDRAQWQLMILVQLLSVCWIAYNLMKSEKVARSALLVLALSCVFLSLLQWTGITAGVAALGNKSARVSALGFHPNNIARILSLGLLSLIGLAYGQRKSFIKPPIFVWISFAIIGITIVQTGSRGGLLALGAGISVFVLRKGSIAVKARNLMLVAVGIGFFIFIASQSATTSSRFEDAFEEGDLARREQIYPAAWEMIEEKPIFGWGPVAAQYELGARLAHDREDSKNAHNLILHVLVSVGIVGAIPVFAGMALALLAAWRARRGSRGVLPLALLTAVLVANMSGIWIGNKMHWLVLGYALSSAAVLSFNKNNKKTRRQYAPKLDAAARAAF
ncbi:MAG: hypothetical protein JWN60_1059 [Acidobacteria bacterium]|nr:hypothetical protein [Acidobacteriota bacterium]